MITVIRSLVGRATVLFLRLVLWLYLLRFPVIVGGALVFSPFMSKGLNAMLIGLFDLSGGMQFFWTACFLFLLTWALRMIACLVLRHGIERIGNDSPKSESMNSSVAVLEKWRHALAGVTLFWVL